MDFFDKKMNNIVKRMYGEGCKSGDLRGTGVLSTFFLGIFSTLVIIVTTKGIYESYTAAFGTEQDTAGSIKERLGLQEDCRFRIIAHTILYHTINVILALLIFVFYKNMAYYCHGAKGFFITIVLAVVYYFTMLGIKYGLDELLYSDLIFEKSCNELIVPKVITRTFDKIVSFFD